MSKWFFVSGENVEQVFITRGKCQTGFLSLEKMPNKFLSQEENVKLDFVVRGKCQSRVLSQEKL